MRVEMRRLVNAGLLSGAAASLLAVVQCGGSSTGPTPPPPPSASLQSVTLSSLSVSGGTPVQGTATLTSAAPSGGATVALSSSNTSAATVPDSVNVPSGSTTGTFTVNTKAVSSTATADISGTYLGITQKSTLSVNALVHADFTVIPDANTTVSAGQCSATQISGTSTQRLLCTFDAGTSTPIPGITSFAWTLPNMTFTGQTLSDRVIPCGGFSSAGTQKDVTLTITAPAGSDTVKKSVTFIKGSPC